MPRLLRGGARAAAVPEQLALLFIVAAPLAESCRERDERHSQHDDLRAVDAAPAKGLRSSYLPACGAMRALPVTIAFLPSAAGASRTGGTLSAAAAANLQTSFRYGREHAGFGAGCCCACGGGGALGRAADLVCLCVLFGQGVGQRKRHEPPRDHEAQWASFSVGCEKLMVGLESTAPADPQRVRRNRPHSRVAECGAWPSPTIEDGPSNGRAAIENGDGWKPFQVFRGPCALHGS